MKKISLLLVLTVVFTFCGGTLAYAGVEDSKTNQVKMITPNVEDPNGGSMYTMTPTSIHIYYNPKKDSVSDYDYAEEFLMDEFTALEFARQLDGTATSEYGLVSAMIGVELGFAVKNFSTMGPLIGGTYTLAAYFIGNYVGSQEASAIRNQVVASRAAGLGGTIRLTHYSYPAPHGNRFNTYQLSNWVRGQGFYTLSGYSVSDMIYKMK